jgi:hypothetical protein
VSTRDEIVAEVTAAAEAARGWPVRRAANESGMSRANAIEAFAECVAGLVDEHRVLSPTYFNADASTWRTRFSYDAIERHTRFFAARASSGGAASRRKRPYDQMAVAFPPAARPVPPHLLGCAVLVGAVRVRALEPVILVRKPRETNPRPHLHTGKPGCGGTLNTLALVAHCTTATDRRCVVVGTRPLTRHQDLEQSVPIALRGLLEDVDHAAFALRGTPAEEALALTPVVSDLLFGGGPHGRGDHNATNTELVAARTMGILQFIHVRTAPGAAQRRWQPRLGVLRLPTEPLTDSGPRRIAPNGLEALGVGWPEDPHKLAAAVGDARSVERQPTDSAPPAGTAYRLDRPGADWCYAPALLTGIGRSASVSLLARRTEDAVRPTVWLTVGSPGTRHAAAVEAFHAARRVEARAGGQLGSPLDRWVTRAYRRHAAGDLLVKGGVGDELLSGVAAAMTAAFMLFTFEHDL